jgi:hypothetical protein
MFQTILSYLQHIIGKRKIIALAGLIGLILGIAFAMLRTTEYTARMSFVVEDSKSLPGSGLLSTISGQFGMDISSALGGGSNLLTGENILELAKSRSFIRQTLLTPYKDSTTSLADKYAEIYHFKQKWASRISLNKEINFHVNQKLDKTEDSLLNKLIDQIIEKDLAIFKPERRLGIFEVNVVMTDDLLPSLFCQRLMKSVSDFYVETKTRRIRRNIARLERLADSLRGYADERIVENANAELDVLDINPIYVDKNASKIINSRNENLSNTVYGEVLRNLELSKASLLQETPTIQVVDQPDYPLKDNKIKWYKGGFFGMMFFALLAIGIFAFVFDPSKAQSR